MRSGRRIAFDFGTVRIGVAISDNSGILASPLITLQATDPELSKQLSELLTQYDPIYLVVGNPRHLSGELGAKSKSAQLFAEILMAMTDRPVLFIDERLTTVSAMKGLRATGHTEKSARSKIDEAAAVAILEQALNQERISGTVAGFRI
jgi:putative Holliday junction resolvase